MTIQNDLITPKKVDQLVSNICESPLFDLNDQYLHKYYSEKHTDTGSDAVYFFNTILPESYYYILYKLDYFYFHTYGGDEFCRNIFNKKLETFIVERILERIRAVSGNNIVPQMKIDEIFVKFDKQKLYFFNTEQEAAKNKNNKLIFAGYMCNLMGDDGPYLKLEYEAAMLMNDVVKPLFGIEPSHSEFPEF